MGCLDLIHLDVCGPFGVHARGGDDCFITFTDDYSSYEYVNLMKKKYEVLDKFKEFKAQLEKQLRRHNKSLCFDRSGEYKSIKFIYFLKEHEILSHFSALETPQQNGVVERRNRNEINLNN